MDEFYFIFTEHSLNSPILFEDKSKKIFSITGYNWIIFIYICTVRGFLCTFANKTVYFSEL